MLEYICYIVSCSTHLEYCGEMTLENFENSKVAMIQRVPPLYGPDRSIVSAWIKAISRDLGIIGLQRSARLSQDQPS